MLPDGRCVNTMQNKPIKVGRQEVGRSRLYRFCPMECMGAVVVVVRCSTMPSGQQQEERRGGVSGGRAGARRVEDRGQRGVGGQVF